MSAPFHVAVTLGEHRLDVSGLGHTELSLLEALESQEDARVDAQGRRYIKDGVCLMPCLLNDTAHRDDANVTHMTALCLDFDGRTPEEYQVVREHLDTLGFEYVAHQTTSHGWHKSKTDGVDAGIFTPDPNNNCFRVWLPFGAPLALDQVRWSAEAGTYQRIAEYTDLWDICDQSCDNESRVLYTPRHIPGAPPRVLWHSAPGLPRLDPTPFVVGGARKSRPVEKALQAVYDTTRPFEHAALLEATKGWGRGVNQEHYRKLCAGEAFGVDDGPENRRIAWRAALGVLGSALVGLGYEWLEPERAFDEICGASWQADRMLDDAAKRDPDVSHPKAPLLELLERAIEHARDEAEALKNVTANMRSRCAAQKANEPPCAATPTIPEALQSTRAVPLSRLKAPVGFEAFQDEAAVLEAINQSAECPVAVDSAGECFVAEWCPSPTKRDPYARIFKAIAYDAFAKQLRGLTYLPAGGGKNAKPKLAAELWLNQSKDRKVGIICTDNEELIALQPYALNLWRGLAIAAAPGDVSPMLELIHHLCGGDEAGEKYLLMWLAWVVQHPTEIPETSIVLKGPQGCGKTFLGNLMRLLFGEYGRIITSSKGLVGNFNARLVGARLVLAEEVSLLKVEDNERVKVIITSEKLDIEFKGKDQFETDNNIALMMLTNNERALCVTEDDRRWAVYNSSPLPHAYNSPGHLALWRARHDWLTLGGKEAWAHYLKSTPLGDFHPRNRPSGLAGLKGEAQHTMMDGPEGWIAEVMEHGLVSAGDGDRPLKEDGPLWLPTYTLWDAYQRWCSKRQDRVLVSREKLGRAMTKVWVPKKGTVIGSGQKPGYDVRMIVAAPDQR